MPYQSKAQAAYMNIHHPKIAKEWNAKTDFSHLPERKHRQMSALKRKLA